jgi:hypothetical protein
VCTAHHSNASKMLQGGDGSRLEPFNGLNSAEWEGNSTVLVAELVELRRSMK